MYVASASVCMRPSSRAYSRRISLVVTAPLEQMKMKMKRENKRREKNSIRAASEEEALWQTHHLHWKNLTGSLVILGAVILHHRLEDRRRIRPVEKK